MRTAPAVSVSCSRGGAWRAFVALMPGLACAALVAWALGHRQAAAWPALLAVVPVSLLVWRLAPPAPVLLDWDGQRWAAAGAAGNLRLMIDFGPWMLLHLQPDDPKCPALWLPVSAAEVGPTWHALRVAVHARAPQTAPDALPAAPGKAVKAD